MSASSRPVSKTKVETIHAIVRRMQLEKEDLSMPQIMQCSEVQTFMTTLLNNFSQVFDLADTHDKVQPLIAQLHLETSQNAHTANLKLAQLQCCLCDCHSEKDRLAVLTDIRNVSGDLTDFELQQHKKHMKLQKESNIVLHHGETSTVWVKDQMYEIVQEIDFSPYLNHRIIALCETGEKTPVKVSASGCVTV